MDKKNNFAYFTDLTQDLWRFDIQKNTKEKIGRVLTKLTKQKSCQTLI